MRLTTRRLRPTFHLLTAALALFGAALGVAPADAGELRLGYSAIGKLIQERLFTDEGRRYLQGSRETPCSYSYVEQPSVNAVAQRLFIRMRFSTQLGLEVSGRCVGTADTFFATVSGRPVYADGMLELVEVEVETEERGYGELVGPLLGEAMQQAFRYPLRERIAQSAEIVMDETGVDLKVPRLEIPEIRLERREMVVPLDFQLVLR